MTGRRIRLAPEEGWLTVGLVGLMALTAAWSLDDAAWVLSRDEWTDFLSWTAVLGVAAGFIGSKVGWNRWLAHLVGAVFAALITPILVGGVLLEDAPLGARFVATAASSVAAWADLVVDGLAATRQTGHHLLVLGLLCWATGQFAAAAVFRHRRPLGAVVVVGAILIGNMAATIRDQLGYLIIFTLASLFLLIRLHALEEETTWLRRRIGDPAAVSAIYLRGGTVFIIAAVLGSLALTATARSAPLAGAWDEVKPWLIDVSQAIQRFLPTGVDSRGIGVVQFGPSATVQSLWSTDSTLALTIQVEPGDERAYYWRAVTYDRFDLYGWNWTESVPSPRPAGEPLLEGTLDQPPAEGREAITVTITPEAHRGPFALIPLAPVSIDRDARIFQLGADGFFEAVQVDGHDPYTVTALVPAIGDATPGGLTKNRLRVAGREYPAEIVDRYLGVPEGAIGVDAQQLLDDIVDRVADPNPYDIAETMEAVLRSNRFRYDTNILDVDCGERSVVECFAWSREGFCQQYASTMTILLRQLGIPARYVQGFLPGDRDRITGVEKVNNTNAHAWVEAYFPGYGWHVFDPTGGGLAQTEPLPSGRPVAGPSANPQPSGSLVPRDGDDGAADPTRNPNAGGPTTPTGGPGSGPLIVVTVLLLLAMALVAFLAWRRGPRGPTTPEGVYAGVARLAGRFGFGPRPTQTAYEYAAALGDLLPDVRPELRTVATAKVEVAYGRRALGDSRLRALAEAQRRLRVGLLRLVFRRRGRQGRHRT